MKRGLVGHLMVAAVILCTIVEAYGADTYYEIWRSESVNPDTTIRLQTWWEITSYDDYTGTPGQHYYYWIRVVTAETKEAYKYSPGSGVSMFLQIKCPIAAEIGTESPIRVRVAMSTLFPPYAVGDLTCRIREDDVVFDNTMEEWTEYDVYVNPGDDIYDVTYDDTRTNDVIISDYEILSPAQVYLWSSYLHQWGIDVYNLEWQTDSVSVTLRDYSDDAPSTTSASQGTYTDRVNVTWSAASGNSGLTAAATGWTGTPTGSLNVTIEPLEARSAGAQWRVDGGSWHDSGYTQSGLSVGQQTVEFSSVSGWDTPANQDIQINDGLTTFITGTYTEQTGSLNVTIEPAGARSAGAQWRVDGGSWHNSGYTQSGLSLSQHTVEFSSVSGWKKPDNQIITIDEGINSETAIYYEYVSFSDINLQDAVEETLGILNPTTQDMLSLNTLRAYPNNP